MKKLIVIVSVLLLQACTTAGPFVSNLSSDGNGGLNIEKCSVKMNAFMGTVSNANCSSQHISIASLKQK